jgi:hypothetical protein
MPLGLPTAQTQILEVYMDEMKATPGLDNLGREIIRFLFTAYSSAWDPKSLIDSIENIKNIKDGESYGFNATSMFRIDDVFVMRYQSIFESKFEIQCDRDSFIQALNNYLEELKESSRTLELMDVDGNPTEK